MALAVDESAPVVVRTCTPAPKSPPEFPDLYGKRRETARVQMLEREISFLEEELKSIERLQPASRSCKEIADFITATPDPLLPSKQKKRRSCRFWKWICGLPCFSCSSIFCCCCCDGCSLQMPRCSGCCSCSGLGCGSCNCKLCFSCKSCFSCPSLTKWQCCCGCPRSNCCKTNTSSCCKNCCTLPSCSCSCPDCSCLNCFKWKCSCPTFPKVRPCCSCKRICCNPFSICL